MVVKLPGEGRLRKLYHGQDKSINEIANIFDCCYRTVRRRLIEHNIEIDTANQDKNGPWRDEEKLERLYVNEGLSTKQLADRWDCDDKTVLNWLHRYDIPTRNSTHDIDRGWRNEDLLRELYEDDGLNDKEIADRLDTNPGTICKWRLRFGIETDDYSGENHPFWRGGTDEYRGENWLEQREKARRRDQHRCQSCSATAKTLGEEPHVHHKIPFSEFNDYVKANRLDNLITLCPSCHIKSEHMAPLVVSTG